jgi:hypothetical protein
VRRLRRCRCFTRHRGYRQTSRMASILPPGRRLAVCPTASKRSFHSEFELRVFAIPSRFIYGSKNVTDFRTFGTGVRIPELQRDLRAGPASRSEGHSGNTPGLRSFSELRMATGGNDKRRKLIFRTVSSKANLRAGSNSAEARSQSPLHTLFLC